MEEIAEATSADPQKCVQCVQCYSVENYVLVDTDTTSDDDACRTKEQRQKIESADPRVLLKLEKLRGAAEVHHARTC